MRGEIIAKILNTVKDGIDNTNDIVKAILVAGYGASASKIDFEYNKLKTKKEKENWQKELLRKKKIRLQKFIYKLKKDKLLNENLGILSLSQKGKVKIINLNNRTPTSFYDKESVNYLTIISFDIPETEKRKRNWFREVIKNLGFEMVHRSTWVGKIKIPAQLIFDLNRMNILEFIEIMEVTKNGTLKKIK